MTAKKTPTRVAARAGGRGKASRSPQPYQAQPRKTSSKLPALYTDAAKALAQITRIDEAKEIRDQAHAMQVYAEQAKDPSLIEHATKVRVHAETRCGELLLEMAAQGTRAAREDNLKRGPQGGNCRGVCRRRLRVPGACCVSDVRTTGHGRSPVAGASS